MAEKATVVASVCTGAFLLAEAGLLIGRQVTTHWGDIDDLRRRYTDLTVHDSSIMRYATIIPGLRMVGRNKGLGI